MRLKCDDIVEIEDICMTEEEICELYNNRVSFKSICAQSGYSIYKVKSILNKNNIKLRTQRLILDEDTEKYLVQEYLNGRSIIDLSKEIGHAKTFVSNVIHKYNVKKTGIKYSMNEHFFDVIDTEAKAYFLGLLFADGNNYYSNIHNKLTIGLQEGDEHILYEFAKQIEFDGGICKKTIPKENNVLGIKVNLKDRYVLELNNKYLCQSAEKLGCIPNKSLKLKFPEWLIDPELQRHFIRGYFDGDGCLSSYIKTKSTNSRSYSWDITSTIWFCNEVKNIISKELPNITSTVVDHTENGITKRLKIKGNRQVLSVCEWMYKDATIYLKRKYEKFLSLKEQCAKLDIEGRKSPKRKNVICSMSSNDSQQ